MNADMVTEKPIQAFALWEKIRKKRAPISFDIELTARCGNNCRHCYINLPAGDQNARDKELSVERIDAIAREAVQLGTVWCLLTGGDPLLRHDFEEIYLRLKKMGLLVSVFTTGTRITDARCLKNTRPGQLKSPLTVQHKPHTIRWRGGPVHTGCLSMDSIA